MTHRTTVLIVDDHPLFRGGLRQVIAGDPRFELVGETGDGETALQLIQEKKPDVAVLDVNLPGLSGRCWRESQRQDFSEGNLQRAFARKLRFHNQSKSQRTKNPLADESRAA